MVKHIQYTQFVEKVLGIKLTLDESCLLMEGIMPPTLKETIEQETELYENFISALVQKIGQIPQNIQKTFTSALDVLKFIHNVISDKTGENLKKAITIITRNCRTLFQKIKNNIQGIPEKLKEIYQKILDWLQTKVGIVLGVKSDVDDADKIEDEGGNWKKFLLLFLTGMLVVAAGQIPTMLKSFGEDVVKSGLSSMLSSTSGVLKTVMSNTQSAITTTIAAPAMAAILPLLKIYAGAKLLQLVNDQLLDSNAWLKK